jgi:MFS family permease
VSEPVAAVFSALEEFRNVDRSGSLTRDDEPMVADRGGVFMNLALGTLYAWSVFVAPLEQRFGWNRSQTSMVFTIAALAFALSFIVSGRLQDRFGPFWISITGGLLVSLSFYMCSYTQTLGWLYFWFGIVGGLGNGAHRTLEWVQL